jgi:hypothetical protein
MNSHNEAKGRSDLAEMFPYQQSPLVSSNSDGSSQRHGGTLERAVSHGGSDA